MDNQLLEKLLKEHNRLIIPGFGAFLRKEGQPSAPIVFSPFLKKDDGLLTQILKSEYGVNNFDAETMTSEWVAHLKESLTTKGKYQINGIGVLVMDANGAMAMVAETVPTPPKPIPSYDSHQGLPTIVQSHPAAEPAEAPVAEQPAAPIVQPIASSQPIAPAQPTISQPITPAPQIIAQQPAAPAPVAQPLAQPAVVPAPQTPFQRPINSASPQQPLTRPAMPNLTQPRSFVPAPRPIVVAPNPANPTNEQPWERPVAPNRNTPQNPTAPVQRPAGAPKPDGKPRPSGSASSPQRPAGVEQPKKRRPAPTQNPQKQKVETLLIVAIVAAIVIVGLIIYGLATVNPTTEFYQPPM